MLENLTLNEINEDILDEVSGGYRSDGKGERQSAKEKEKSIIMEAQKRISDTVKAGKALKCVASSKPGAVI